MEPKKTDRRIKYTKKILKDSLIELLEQKTISKITIKELCETADINRSTFYAHYTDQYDLLSKIEKEVMEEVKRQLSDITFDDREAKTCEVIHSILSYALENKKLCRILLGENGTKNFQKELVALVQYQFISEWSTYLSIDKDTAGYLCLFATIGCIGVLQKWLEGDSPTSAAEMTHIITQLANNGLAAFL